MATRHRRPERSRRTLNMELLAGEDRFDTQIAYWAKEYGIPFALLKGMVSVESRFAEKAWREEPHIKDGSRGLMQILEKTARGIGFTEAADKLFEVDTNLKWGTKFFRSLLDRANYTVLDAIAAYNMGSPRPAAKTTPIIEKIYGKPDATWTYANEPYVRRVAANTAFYEAKATGQTAAAEAILAAVKKKKLPNVYPMISSILAESTPGRPRQISLTYDWPRIEETAKARAAS